MTALALSGAGGYRRSSLRRLALVGAGLAGLGAAFLVDLSIGPGPSALRDVVGALLDPAKADSRLAVVVFDLRLPMALMAVTVGAAMLELAGAGMRTILNNPLADPSRSGSRRLRASALRLPSRPAGRSCRASARSPSRSTPSRSRSSPCSRCFAGGLTFGTLAELAGRAGFVAIARGSYGPIARAQRRVAPSAQDRARTWLCDRFILTGRKRPD